MYIESTYPETATYICARRCTRPRAPRYDAAMHSLWMWLTACSPPTAVLGPAGDSADTGLTDPETGPTTAAGWLLCAGAPVPADPPTGFREPASSLFALADADHSADDLLFTDRGLVTFAAKFTYGVAGKDLQHEDVEIGLDTCGPAATRIGVTTTDGDGRVRWSADPSALPGYGAFAVTYRVAGDGSSTAATLRVLPVGTRLVVADIDGTLTVADSELFAAIADPTYVARAREDAVAAMWARADQGYPLLYLTGRPYALTAMTRGWLDTLGFPAGSVQLVADATQVLPTDGAVGTYKADTLAALQARGFQLDAAYGNATTDIYGYGEAGIDVSSTYILGEHGGEGGTVALGEAFTDHLAWLLTQPPAAQPAP